jgi:hypothetical protein
MEKTNDPKLNTTSNSKQELRVWETPQLFIENMETITESGNFAVSFGDDGYYVS